MRVLCDQGHEMDPARSVRDRKDRVTVEARWVCRACNVIVCVRRGADQREVTVKRLRQLHLPMES